MADAAPPTAALAGIPAGLQAQGVWAGRRQLFVRFAGEAETATMYTADALANELRRGLTRSAFHSIAITGRDPLANVDYLCAALEKIEQTLPVMIDTDGQRPEALASLTGVLKLVQVSFEGPVADAVADRAFESIRVAARAGLQHALVLTVDERTSDVHVLRLVERVRAASERTSVVLHPGVNIPVDRDRRWITLLERVAAVHADARVTLKLPPPTGMR